MAARCVKIYSKNESMNDCTRGGNERKNIVSADKIYVICIVVSFIQVVDFVALQKGRVLYDSE